MLHLDYFPFDKLYCDYLETDEPRDLRFPQYHNVYEIFLQVKGTRYIFLNGNCYAIKPMDLFVAEPYELHYAQSLDAKFYGRYVLNFDDEDLRVILSPEEHQLLISAIKTGVYHLEEPQYNRILSLFQALERCHNDEGPLSEKVRCANLFLLLTLIRDSSDLNGATTAPDPSARPEILAAINYINKHYREPLTLDDVAERVDLSMYHFCRLFKATTGTSFVQYLNNLRIIRAHKVLLETDLPIGDIASLAGFSSREQFTRVFKSAYHLSPAEFRKQNRSV